MNNSDRVYQSNTYKLLGAGRSSSAFGSRNSQSNFVSHRVNAGGSIDSNSSNNLHITASFEEDAQRVSLFALLLTFSDSYSFFIACC